MAKHGEKYCARILAVYFTYSYFVRIMCEHDSCLSLQWTGNTNSQRHKFPQQHYSGSRGLCASAAENLIFPSSCTPKFRSLYQKCSRWVSSSLLPHSSASWDLTAASFPPVFHLMPANYLDYSTGYSHCSATPAGQVGREEEGDCLAHGQDDLNLPWVNCLSVRPFFPTLWCTTIWEFGSWVDDITSSLRNSAKTIRGY